MESSISSKIPWTITDTNQNHINHSFIIFGCKDSRSFDNDFICNQIERSNNQHKTKRVRSLMESVGLHRLSYHDSACFLSNFCQSIGDIQSQTTNHTHLMGKRSKVEVDEEAKSVYKAILEDAHSGNSTYCRIIELKEITGKEEDTQLILDIDDFEPYQALCKTKKHQPTRSMIRMGMKRVFSNDREKRYFRYWFPAQQADLEPRVINNEQEPEDRNDSIDSIENRTRNVSFSDESHQDPKRALQNSDSTASLYNSSSSRDGDFNDSPTNIFPSDGLSSSNELRQGGESSNDTPFEGESFWNFAPDDNPNSSNGDISNEAILGSDDSYYLSSNGDIDISWDDDVQNDALPTLSNQFDFSFNEDDFREAIVNSNEEDLDSFY
eukprot:TRINITY_DN5245_c0_g1_i2.p1 TRINITY_DN5245_c0_g1~~TRINITY_DN5245_c0_g1_i2.p1  ORF type:complete len:381 (+),score=75.76 TRINITY_DN5245_c0_g1_i2:235-1377(+)